MENKDLKEEISKVLFPLGFKRKGNNWIQETIQLYRIVNLQKSYYGNFYYINYGFTIKGLEKKDCFMHVSLGLSADSARERTLIRKMLDLTYPYTDEKRTELLRYIIEKNVLTELLSVSTEDELRLFVMSRNRLSDTFLFVKEYLKIDVG